MSGVNELVNFIRVSPMRLGELAVLADRPRIYRGLPAPIMSDTMDIVLRYTSPHSLVNLLVPVHDELLSISEALSNDRGSMAKVRGFAEGELVTGQFELFFVLLVAAFEMTDCLSKSPEILVNKCCDGQKTGRAFRLRIRGQLLY